MNNFESELQPQLPYSDDIKKEETTIMPKSEEFNNGDTNTDGKSDVESTNNQEDERGNYLTKDGRDIDPNLKYGIYHAVKSFNEDKVDTFSLTDFRRTLINKLRKSEISDNFCHNEYDYARNFPNIVFLEETDIKDPDEPNKRLYRILQDKFNEFVSHKGLNRKENGADTSLIQPVESVKSINPEIPSEEIGLSTLLKTVLSESKIKYWSKTDSSSDINNNEGMLTREPLITEILKIMGLDTQKCRWMAEEILESANRKNMLETVQHNEKGEPYFVLNFVRRLELNNIDNDLKTLEMANFINEKRNYALSGKKENGTENIQDTLTGLEWEDQEN